LRTMLISLAGFLLSFYAADAYPQSSLCTPLFLDRAQIGKLRSLYAEQLPKSKSFFRTFLYESDSLLAMKPLSVMDKSQTPPSGDKHDFLSMGPYWWPDSTKPDGLPYIRKDGRRNPEYSSITDQLHFGMMLEAVEKLTIAYSITRDRRYSGKAADLLRVWFLDKKTRMNPNMNHAQFIPGVNTGRGIGIIETRSMHKILDAICLLRSSREWNKVDDGKITDWFGEYFHWLTTHQYGIDESNEKNNHGSWYDVQVVSLALFLGKDDLARTYLERAKEKRIAIQIEADGKQPLELARTNSWSYSIMNLTALFHLATLGDRVGVDLWRYRNADGGSIRKALDFLLPFAANMQKWEYQQIGKFEIDSLRQLLLSARSKYDKAEYTGWLNTLSQWTELTIVRMISYY
jgi:hypothetical protein